MAILLRTMHPQEIVDAIKTLIDERELTPWEYDEDGDMYIPNVFVWIHPQVLPNRLDFYVVGRNDMDMSLEEYAVVHGKFIEMLLLHFPEVSKNITVTSPLVNFNDSMNVKIDR